MMKVVGFVIYYMLTSVAKLHLPLVVRVAPVC